MSDRIETLRAMLDRDPTNTSARFGLAVELMKQEEWEEAAEQLRRYLEQADDEGNAYGRLGHALRMLGREEEAKGIYRQGVQVALQHGHPSMAEEFEAILSDLEGGAA